MRRHAAGCGTVVQATWRYQQPVDDAAGIPLRTARIMQGPLWKTHQARRQVRLAYLALMMATRMAAIAMP